jgi:hypothetical protein
MLVVLIVAVSVLMMSVKGFHQQRPQQHFASKTARFIIPRKPENPLHIRRYGIRRDAIHPMVMSTSITKSSLLLSMSKNKIFIMASILAASLGAFAVVKNLMAKREEQTLLETSFNLLDDDVQIDKISALVRDSGRIRHSSEVSAETTPDIRANDQHQQEISVNLTQEKRSSYSGGGLLKKLFGQKPAWSESRSTSLASALLLHLPHDEQSRRYEEQVQRIQILQILLSGLSTDTRYSILRRDSSVENFLTVTRSYQEKVLISDHNRDKYANLFADVSNALVVLTFDNAYDALQNLNKKKDACKDDAVDLKSERERASQMEEQAAVMERVYEVLDVTGAAYSKMLPDITNVSPLLYTGRLSKSHLENLYAVALRVRSKQQTIVVDELQQETNKEQRHLDLLQFLCGIKEAKRAQLEQQVLLEVLLEPHDGTDFELNALQGFDNQSPPSDSMPSNLGDLSGSMKEIKNLWGVPDMSSADHDNMFSDLFATFSGDSNLNENSKQADREKAPRQSIGELLRNKEFRDMAQRMSQSKDAYKVAQEAAVALQAAANEEGVSIRELAQSLGMSGDQLTEMCQKLETKRI